VTREDAELCGWGLRNVDHGRRWVARRGADVVSGYSLASVLEQVERETNRIIRENEERTPAPDAEPTRSDLLRAGWRFKPYVIEPTAGPRYASGWTGWQALKDGVRVYCGDTQAEVMAAAAVHWKAARA
jgi:hypothetical protein